MQKTESYFLIWLLSWRSTATVKIQAFMDKLLLQTSESFLGAVQEFKLKQDRIFLERAYAQNSIQTNSIVSRLTYSVHQSCSWNLFVFLRRKKLRKMTRGGAAANLSTYHQILDQGRALGFRGLHQFSQNLYSSKDSVRREPLFNLRLLRAFFSLSDAKSRMLRWFCPGIRARDKDWQDGVPKLSFRCTFALWIKEELIKSLAAYETS